MDNQDQGRTHIAGHESHGVHLCHKCGWPFPNPHPSAKHRRAHRKICGTVEGYKLSVSEGQPRLNGSDDEHVSDDDHKTPGLVVSGPNSLETGNSKKGNGEKIMRSEDEVFSDAVADFSDSGSNPEIKECLQDSLDSGGVEVERVDIKELKFSGSSEDRVFDDADARKLIGKSANDCQIQNHNLQNESVEVGNTDELEGQLSGPTVDPLSSSIADLKTEESIIVDSDVFFGLSTDSTPSKAEAMPDILPEKNICASENVTDCNLISVAKENNLKEKDEINFTEVVVEIVESPDSNKIGGETCEGVSEIEVSDVVSSDHQVGNGTVHLNEKKGAEINSNRDLIEIGESSDTVVGETGEEVSIIAVSDVSLDHQLVDGAVTLKEKNGADVLSLLPPDNLPLELNSVVMTNDAQGESAYVVQFAASIDDKILLEKGEGNVKVDPLPTSNDRLDEAHRQSEYGDLKNLEGVVYQNPFLQSSESLEYEGDGLNDTVTEENKFHFNTSQLSENSDVFSTDVDAVVSSMKTELVNSEPIPEEMHAKEHTEVSPVKLTVESLQRSDEIEASVNSMKTGMNENHIVHLPEGSIMASSNERQRDEHFGSATSEACGVINTKCKNHHEINDVALDGKVVRANIENHIEIKLKDHQPGDILLSDDLFKSDDAGKNDAAGEMGKNEQCDVPDAQCKEIPTVSDTSLPKSSTSDFDTPVISESSEMVADGPANNSNGTECRKIDSLSGTQKDIKEDEININVKLNEEYNESVDTSAHSQQAQGSELLVKAAEDLARKYTFPLTIEASAQHDTAVEDHSGGDPGREVSGFTAVPVQDQTGNTLVKLGSSGVDASVDSGSQCDSLEGNWGSVSVLSMQSDAPAGIDSETLPSTGVPSIEAGNSNINNPKAALARQQSGKSEMFEPPSFMTLVEPRQVSPKVAASEGQKEQNPQQADPTSQAAWFPTLTQVVNESQGRKKNEEIIAKVTNWSTTKEHTPLKSLLGEAAHDNKPKSPKMEESLVNQMSSKVAEKNGSGLTTVNSILGPESPSAQVVKGEAAQEWNSPARYPADIKREKRKVKSRPYWIQLVCCTSVGPQRR